MLEGYTHVASLLAEPAKSEVRKKFDATVAALKSDAGTDARDYGEQLLTVLAYFQRTAE